MPDVAALNVVISADTKDLEAGLARAEQSVSKAGSAIQSAMGGALIAGVAGLGAALVGSVKSAADFEKGLSAISAVSGATKSELEGIRATALQLGKDTSFSASEAAAGMEEMVKAGVSLQDVMGGAGRAALDLAAAGGLSVAESATIASNAMNVFSLKGSDMAHVADVIAGAANASAIDVHDFGFSLSAVGAVAATVGLGLEDTATAIAILGQAGLKGSDAGTSLKTMLLNLDPASKTARAAMKSLGIITADGANQFFDAQGKAKSLADISGILQNALKGLTKEQQLSALQTMFGTDAIRAAAIMAKAGSEGFNAMSESMSKVTAKAVAMERLNNVAGSFETLKGSLETAAIMLGSLFLPALKGALDGMTSFVNGAIEVIEKLPEAWGLVVEAFSGGGKIVQNALENVLRDMGAGDWAKTIVDGVTLMGEAWRQLLPYLQAAGDWFADNVAPIATFVTTFLGVIGAAGLVSSAIAGVTAVLGLLLSPLGLVATAIGLLAVAWQTNFLQIRDIVARVLSGDIKGAFDLFITNLSAMVTTIAEKLKLWGQAFIDWIAPMIPPFLAALAAMAVQFYAWIAAQIPPLIAQLLLWGQQFVAWVAPMIPPFLAAIAELARQFYAWIVAQAPILLAQLATWTEQFVAWAAAVGAPLVQALMTMVAAIKWFDIFNAAVTAVAEVTRWFTQLITTLDWEGIGTATGKAFAAMLTAAFSGKTDWKAIGATLSNLLGAMLGLAITSVDAWVEFNKGFTTSLVKVFTDMDPAEAARSFGKWLGGVLTTGAQEAAANAGTAVGNAIRGMLGLGLGSTSSGGGVKTLSYLSTTKGAIDNSSREAFLKSAYPYALEAAMGDAKLAQQLLATAISENGAVGTGKDLSTMGFNVGGIQGVQGTAGSFTAMDAGRPRQFAAYNNLSEGFGAVRDLITSGRYAPAYEKYKKTGDVDQFWADVGAAGYAEDPAWATKVGNIRRNQVEPVTVRIPKGGAADLGNITMTQAQWGQSVGMTPAEAAAACGPYAASIFAQATGRMPNPAEAEKLARLAGWTEAGMGGTGNFMNLLGSMGVNAVRTSTAGMSNADITQMAANAGPLTAFSTPDHYFASTGFDPATQKFNVGATGTFAGGSEWMTVAEMSALAKPIQDIVTLAGQMGTAFNDASAATLHASGAMATGVTANAATMATGVIAQTDLMATGALTSVTNLGTGFLTTVQTTAGTSIATVTDMSGQITSQYATLANGVVLNAGTMQTGVLTATTAMHDGTILSVQDMAGNAIVTVTDMNGQVTNQYTTMAAESGAVLSEFAALNLEQFGAVAESALKPIEPIEQLGSALADIPQADMSDTVKQFGEAAQAAKKAQAAIKALADATEDLPGSFGGSKGGKSSGLSKKAAGGWASGLTLVGEEGPELLSLNRPHYVTPNSALSGGGGPVTVVNVSVGGSLVAQSELEETIARAVATSLRGGSLAWSG